MEILKPVVKKSCFQCQFINSFLYIVNLLLHSGKGKLNFILNMTKTDIFEENFGDVRQEKQSRSICMLSHCFSTPNIMFLTLPFCGSKISFQVVNCDLKIN